jgi:hypothetical protein
MKKILAVFLACLIMLSTMGCGELTTNTADNDNTDIMVRIDDYDFLWYDSTTRIVYWWNGKIEGYTTATTPSPYYAPNGLPYRYNPETNILEEIVVDSVAEATDAGNE